MTSQRGIRGQKSTQIDFFDFCQAHISVGKNTFPALKKHFSGLKMALVGFQALWGCQEMASKRGIRGQKSTQIDFFDFCQKHISVGKNTFPALKKHFSGLKMAFFGFQALWGCQKMASKRGIRGQNQLRSIFSIFVRNRFLCAKTHRWP